MLPLPDLSTLFAKLLTLAIQSNPNVSTDKLEGRRFAIAIDELPQDIAIQVQNGEVIALADDHVAEADVIISGNIKAILNMIKNEDGLDSDELYISGKISAAKHFQHFLASLSIDWHGFFGRFLPDEHADKAADAVQQALHFAKGGVEQLGSNLKRYLIEEKQLLVTRGEFTTLQRDTEQLTTRLDELLIQLEHRL